MDDTGWLGWVASFRDIACPVLGCGERCGSIRAEVGDSSAIIFSSGTLESGKGMGVVQRNVTPGLSCWSPARYTCIVCSS
jgi:hypothetical protein